MSTSTPNIGLTLPIGTEKVSRAIINENMTKIDTAIGNINRATMRNVPFTLDLSDWTGSGSSWSATFDTAYVTSTSNEILTYTSSLRTAKAEDIDASKKSGGGGVVFTTTKKPVASISGTIYVWDSDDGKIPTIIEGTVTPIANGGTGASSVAGAKNNLGISAVESSVQNLSEQLANLQFYMFSYDCNGKSKNTNYDVDLPSGYTADKTMIVAIGYNLGGDIYPAYYLGGLDNDVKMAIRIISTNKIRFQFIGTYSTNGTVKVLLAKYP